MSKEIALTYRDWQQVAIWLSMLGRCCLPDAGATMRYIRMADIVQREMELLDEARKRIEGETPDKDSEEMRDKVVELFEQPSTLNVEPLRIGDIVGARMIATADNPAVDDSVKMAGNIMLMYRLGIVDEVA